MDPLTLRLAVGTALLVVGPLVAGFFLYSRHHLEESIRSRSVAAEQQARMLAAALRHQMINSDRRLMPEIFHQIGDQPAIRSAMLIDHDGEIRVASDESQVGVRLSKESPSCAVCHAFPPADRHRWTLVRNGNEEVLRTVLPIENRKECHGCHDPEKRWNGILVLDSEIANVHLQLSQDTLLFLGGAALLALILLAGMRFLVHNFVLRRLSRLGRTARAISAGELDRRAQVVGRDVIASLASDFNDMADTVLDLLGEVKRQEAQLSDVLNSLDDGLVVLDRDYRILASNRSFCRRQGTHPEAIRNRLCHRPDGIQLACCAAEEECPTMICMATGKIQRRVFQRPTQDGSAEIVEEVYVSPVFDSDGEVAQVVEIWRDITERMEEEKRLAEIERMVSLGTLASGFSHEVNTPLATVLTCAESVLGRLDQRSASTMDQETIAAIRESGAIIRDQVLRCRRITEQFRRFSRGVPPGTEPLDLDQVVAGVLDLVRPTAREKGIEIVSEEHPPLPMIRANAELVQHVVLNLLVNAVQSQDDGGGEIRIRFLVGASGAQLRLRIQDRGVGIPPQQRPHLFEPFRSDKPSGTGLGLFLSRSFMRRFGGDVRLVWSEPGRGSIFEIVFSPASPPTS